jgi:intracellular septation protein
MLQSRSGTEQGRPSMKALHDYFTLICFFATYAITRNIYDATAVGMASSVAQYLFMLIKNRSFKNLNMLAFVTLLWLIFGALTLYFHDQRFIQWKPTILYWSMALILLGSHFIGTRTVYEWLLAEKIALPQRLYRQLNASWSVFFALMGALNILVAYHTSLSFWVYYKIFGTLSLTILFVIGQAIVMNQYMIEPKKNGATHPKPHDTPQS